MAPNSNTMSLPFMMFISGYKLAECPS